MYWFPVFLASERVPWQPEVHLLPGAEDIYRIVLNIDGLYWFSIFSASERVPWQSGVHLILGVEDIFCIVLNIDGLYWFSIFSASERVPWQPEVHLVPGAGDINWIVLNVDGYCTDFPYFQQVNESPDSLKYIWYPELEIYGLEIFGRQRVLKGNGYK